MRKEKTRPRLRPGSKSGRGGFSAGPVRSVADLDAAEAPAVTIPETLANPTARGRRFFHIHRGGTAGRDGAADDRTADDSASHGCAEAALCACRSRGERTSDRCNRDKGSKCLVHVLGSPGDGALSQRRV